MKGSFSGWVAGWLVPLALGLSAWGQVYVPPPTTRTDTLLNTGWRFIRQDVAGAQAAAFDDSGWSTINLPHTWNNLDGQDGGNNYYRGIGWYRIHVTPPATATNRGFFLKFDGAFLVADVYINGTLVGEHQGGFAAFVFDVTTNLILGADNLIAVKVSNAYNANIPPLSADFTFFGGLYREVHLLATDPVQVSPLDYGSPGVYLKPYNVSSNAASVQITTVVSNATSTTAAIALRTVLTDAATNVVQTLTNLVTLPPGAVSNVVTTTTLTTPHLWNGLSDPYLYRAFVELWNGTNVTDLVSQPLGFRWFQVDPANGFFLNGRYYDIHGVCMHQDWLDCGWALNSAQRQTNFMFLKELGATGVRLAHYQHHDETYQLADQNGILLWSEIPLVNSTTGSSAFYNNAKQQLRELIRQNYNHPSVVCWGMYNELSLNVNTGPTNLVNQLVQLEAQEDPTRPSTGAVLGSNGDANAWYPQQIAFNEYYGWYADPINGLAAWADNIHAAHPNNPIGISEYGAGASIYQHSEDPVSKPATTGGPFHPEEWQNLVHETNWAVMKARPFLWCKFLWNLFNFAVDGRNEGDTSGRNDKGLATYDRLVRKDAFYFYKANWTTNPMAYITGHTFTNRLTNAITAKVYANCDTVELFLNGLSQGARAGTNCIFTWPVTLPAGSNFVQAFGTKGAVQVSDTLAWSAPLPISITNPATRTVFLNSTNDVLSLAGAVSAPVGSFQVFWNQSSGPGVVSFANSNSLVTTARFSAEGIYGLQLTGSNGVVSTASLTVVVNPAYALTNGLTAWWKMDETGGTLAADSSGFGRNATLVGTSFTSGTISNALHLAGSTGSYGSYPAADGNQVTLAAWVRADGSGGGSYPFIVGSPSYRFIFRFTGTDANSVGFATWDGVNGDYDSGAGTISQGIWYHVAVSFDRSHLSTPPVFYINGSKMNTRTLATASGAPPPLTGTGYIGNRYNFARGWNGLLDDLRIYSRVLSDTEVQALAAMPPVNVAPSVSAGANQTWVWPTARTTLSGSATDDGKPNPMKLSWTQLSGPGPVQFGNSNAAVTTVTVPAPGLYGLQLLADDGQVQTVAAMTLTVLSRPSLVVQVLPSQVQLSWPGNNGSWRLQSQTNAPGTGLGANWVDVPGSALTNWMNLPLSPAPGAVFYRLLLP